MNTTPNHYNEQEAFWAGQFGTDYSARNRSDGLLAANLAFFSKALRKAEYPKQCLEFGANIGMNLRAIQLLFPSAECYGIEINATAAAELAKAIPAANITVNSIMAFTPTREWDLVLAKGVLIHLDPSSLPQVYDRLVKATKTHLLIAEYYNPIPTEVPYRGHERRLFKRDFAGELLDSHSSLSLIDYGFVYHRDPLFPLDDITWFLFRKK